MSEMPARAVSAVVAAIAVAGCAAATPAAAPAPQPASAAAPAPSGGRHGGRDGGGGGATTASWPAGVPFPTGAVQQISAANGLYMVTVRVGSGLATACPGAVAQFRAAGWSPQDPAVNTATDPTVLRGPAYVATVVCTAADHSPSETLVTVHLGPA